MSAVCTVTQAAAASFVIITLSYDTVCRSRDSGALAKANAERYLFFPGRRSLRGKRATSTSITPAHLSTHRRSSQLTFLNGRQSGHLPVIFRADINHPFLRIWDDWYQWWMGNKSICFRYTRARPAPFVYIIGIQQSPLMYDACHLFLLSLSATEKRSDENLILKKNDARKDLIVNLLRPGRRLHP